MNTTVVPQDRVIRINAPGAGPWIMERCDGFFTPETDHSIASFRGGRIVGGFALTGFLGAAICVHMAGDDEHWCSRDMMWMLFHYIFVQLGLRKAVAMVRSNNYLALSQDLRAGYRLEAVVENVFPDAHMMVLTMERHECRWLNITPRAYRAGSLEVA